MRRVISFLWLGWAANCGFIVAGPAQSAAPVYRAAILSDPASGVDPSFAHELAAQAESAGYSAGFIDFSILSNSNEFMSQPPDLLVLPNGRSLPIEAIPTIRGYLQSGGDVVALGLPLWESPLYNLANRWISRANYEKTIADQRPDHMLLGSELENPSRWTRSSNNMESKSTAEFQPTDRGSALHVVVENLTGWDTLATPPLDTPFPPGHSLTCFLAKAAPQTRQMILEWTERDGSRWIAPIELTTQWKRYALSTESFHAWEPPAGRGGPADRLHPEKAIRFSVGLAFSHTSIGGGRHEYWIAGLGTAQNPFGEAPFPSRSMVPRLESLSPAYQVFPVQGPVELSVPADFAWLTPVQWKATSPMMAVQPRPSGIGYNQDRPWRWQPLLEARADDGEYRGAVAVMLVNVQSPFRGGIWAGFTPANPAFYRQPAMQRVLFDVLAQIRRGLFLREGGSEFFTVFNDQSFHLGARVVDFGKTNAMALKVRLIVGRRKEKRTAIEPIHAKTPITNSDRLAALTPVLKHEWTIDLAPGEEGKVDTAWQRDDWPVDGFVVVTELINGNKVIDRLEHELHVWLPPSQPNFIEAREGGFWLDGKPWKAHGVNYMPSSGIGMAGDYFEYWLGRGAYDPAIIERDLRRIKAMNMNAVSVFVDYRSLSAQHLLDFLRQCRDLGLRVNQSLRPGTPLDFPWDKIRALIEHYRLAQNDTVFAYDLAWEPSHYDHRHQLSYEPAWNAWIIKRYGAIAAAENAWGIAAPPSEQPSPSQSVGIPQATQLTHDGPWRKMVADYRSFLDDLLREKYAAARRLVRSVDPHHPVSFRMQFAGDPTFNSEGLFPYDFHGLANAVDIWEPEAYGRIGDWNQVKPGRFTAAYARLCDPAKPVLWAEMGYTVWDTNRQEPDPAKLDFEARYYRDFYRMLRDSGADGVFFWWYPGGFRLNENSDFGIINPDGTDRPVTRVIREEGPLFLTAPKPPQPTRWIEVDRDRDARGLFGIYQAVKDDYWKAIENGENPGLKWRQPPGARK
ncbi:MAG: beta-galactosidase [Candidatus Omnitrophica bacterium]|nr:beta-galactosidase [Candidatus Omnitrophota bacterium]